MEVPNTASSAKVKGALSGHLDTVLRRYGFEPRQPVHEFYHCFEVKDALASMTESTYSNPIAVHLRSENGNVDIPVIVTRADVQYQPFEEGPAGCFERPYWYFEGWVLKSGFDPFDQITRVRVLREGSDGLVESVLWQVIPKDPDPDGPPFLSS